MMKTIRIRLIFCLIIGLTPLTVNADQLMWNSRSDVERVVTSIRQKICQWPDLAYYMISYCSLCDDERIEVWEVKNVLSVAVDNTKYFEMQVIGRPVLRSVKLVNSDKYQEPIGYVPITLDESKPFRKSVDLAYIYIPSADGSFYCAGKAFQLDCEVNVERMIIPNHAFQLVKLHEGSTASSMKSVEASPCE